MVQSIMKDNLLLNPYKRLEWHELLQGDYQQGVIVNNINILF